MNIVDITSKFFDSSTVKGAALSIACTAGGFLISQVKHETTVDSTIAWHSKALADLKTGQAATNQALSEHALTLMKIDGKLDVITTKIEDDRNYNERHQPKNTR